MATSEIRSPVKREGAEQLMLISLVSFALSVIGTRLFLHLAGYPMIANEVLHIAHVLWGGLLLFIGALLPLIWANYWALQLSAVLGGVGMGLFIDEVGKFITMNNDYHFQPAAPIIYVSFLVTVFVYLRVKRPREHTPRDEMYRILGEFSELLDHDLDESEHERVKQRLAWVSEKSAENPNLRRLSGALYDFLVSEELALAPHRPTRFQRYTRPFADLFLKVINRARMKAFLIFALALTGVLALVQFVALAAAIPNPIPNLSVLLEPVASLGRLRSAQEALWYLGTVILEGIAGTLLIVAGVMIAARRELAGTRLASLTLVAWLAVINLMVFYFNQFGATAFALVQFFVLLAVSYYRGVYLRSSP